MRLSSLSLSALAIAVTAFGVAISLDRPVQAQATVQSAVRGKVLFLRCASCHAITANAPAKIGPGLAGIVGRKGGSVPGFRYSPAMKKIAPVWDEATLDRWLASPTKVVPGTSMAFAGLSNPADRQALIAYLKAAR